MRMMILFICCGFLIVSCSTHKNPKYQTVNENVLQSMRQATKSNVRAVDDIPQFEETQNLMAPGFLFTLHHPTDSKLQGSYRIMFDGTLNLPYSVRIETKGLTFKELRSKVLDAYDAFFQRGSANVSFRLAQKEYWVEVRGFVKKPGVYLVKRKESLDKVIDLAGGLVGSVKQDLYSVSLKQQNMSYMVNLNQYYEENVLASSFVWTGGDVIFINTAADATDVAPTVEILGGVNNPGKVLYQEDANVFHYIAKRGGAITNLGYEEVYLVRKGEKGLVSIKFSLTDMETIPSIEPGDTILLNSERRTLLDKIWERATQVSSIIATLAFLIIAL